MKNSGKNKIQNGFLLLEALIALLVLSIGITACLGGIQEFMHMTKRTEETTMAILFAEHMVFDLDSGERLDLVRDGGRMSGSGDYSAKIQSQKYLGNLRKLHSEVTQTGRFDRLSFDLFIPEVIYE